MAHLIKLRSEVITSSSVHADRCVARRLFLVCLRRTSKHHRFLIAQLHVHTTLHAFTLDLVIDGSLNLAVVLEGLRLLRICKILGHTTLASFHDSLGLFEISSACLLCSLHHAIVRYHLIVGVLLYCFSFIADFLSLCDDT